MIEKPTVFASHKASILTTLLGNHLFKKVEDPFAKKCVFLPSLSLKEPLQTAFIEEGGQEVVLGIDFFELSKGVSTVFQELTGKTLLFPPQDLLTLFLEPHLERPHLAPLLAKEFIRYGKYGGEFIKSWKGGWQKELWGKVASKWNYPYELLEANFKAPKKGFEIHIFNFPFLPKLYHLFFAKVSKFVPVYYYQFSPCKEFWSDMVSDAEKMHLLEKNGELSLYLNDGHPLLKNLGRLGRETFRVFEEEEFIIEERYEEERKESYLNALQNDMLHFQESSPKKDSSILLLPASSKHREVEILYTKLLTQECAPSEIQVFAPDISTYAPFIELVFGSDESPFDYEIKDLSKNASLQAFLDLLSLNENRFDPTSIFKLFSNPYFALFTDIEVKELKKFFADSGVKWGVDSAHRKKLLPGYSDSTKNGTWEEAFKHLLTNLIFLPENPSSWDLPYLDTTDSILLGKCTSTVRSLRKDLDQLFSKELSGFTWADLLLELLSRYFTLDEQSLSPLHDKILSLKELDATYSFSSIKRFLESGLKEKRGVKKASQLQSITFRSLKPGAIFSSHTVAILGMHEGAFPRVDAKSSLDLLGKKGDFIPRSFDEDRFLFLETLFAGANRLFITYQSISEEDGKAQPPSLLVQELDPVVEKHPPFPFHFSYFEKSRIYSKKQFEIAKSYYGPHLETPFIKEYLTPSALPKVESIIEPTIDELSRFAKNPLRYYCNATLNLYLHYEDHTDPEFFLSPLEKHRLLLTETSFQEAEERGFLPLGRFNELAKRKIEEDIALDRYEEMTIQGKDPLSELVKIYPLYLNETVENPSPLISLKNETRLELKTDPKAALKMYLEYYNLSLQTPSPLHPKLADAFLKKDAKTLISRLKTLSHDPYIETVFKGADPQVVFDTWSPTLRKTFAPMLEMLDDKV